MVSHTFCSNEGQLEKQASRSVPSPPLKCSHQPLPPAPPFWWPFKSSAQGHYIRWPYDSTGDHSACGRDPLSAPFWTNFSLDYLCRYFFLCCFSCLSLYTWGALSLSSCFLLSASLSPPLPHPLLRSSSFLTSLSFFFFFFLQLHAQHMEVPRLGVEWELQLPAYTTATAMQDPSWVCNLHHSCILNPLSKARGPPGLLMDTRRVLNPLSPNGNSSLSFLTTWEISALCSVSGSMVRIQQTSWKWTDFSFYFLVFLRENLSILFFFSFQLKPSPRKWFHTPSRPILHADPPLVDDIRLHLKAPRAEIGP